MARGRKFRTTRRIPETERALFEQKFTGYYSRTLDRTELLDLVRGGEDTYLEFKVRLVNTEKISAEIVALANTGGGAIIFGVNDQRRVEGLDDPEQVEEQIIDICRNQITPPILPHIDKVAFDNGARLIVLEVDDRRAPHATLDQRYFIRIGSTKREADSREIAALFARSRVAAFEDRPILTASMAEIDEALIWSFVRDLEGETFQEPAGFPTEQAMRDLLFAIEYAGRFVPTLAGLLLFGRNQAVEQIAPQSRIELLRYSGTGLHSPIIEHSKVAGNLPRLFDRTLAFIKRYADLWEARPNRANGHAASSAPVSPRANYGHDVVVEALTNLLAHRDYAINEPSARVMIFDDRVELTNPSHGEGVRKKTIDYGATARPNPRLHHILTKREYGLESAQRGIPALRRAHTLFARCEPKISTANGEFRIELFGM